MYASDAHIPANTDKTALFVDVYMVYEDIINVNAITFDSLSPNYITIC